MPQINKYFWTIIYKRKDRETLQALDCDHITIRVDGTLVGHLRYFLCSCFIKKAGTYHYFLYPEEIVSYQPKSI